MVRRHTNLYIVILFFLSLVGCLFYKTVIHGHIPFPGDLLLSEYAPFRHTDYFGYAAGGIPSKGQYFDVVRELYPWKTLVIDAIKQKTLPLWNPYSFSGTPLLANYQSQVFYPLGILYLILPQPVAWTIMVMLQIFLGLVFMYLFARSIGLSLPSGIIAAITFNVSSFSISWVEFNTVWHTILWLPLLLYIVERGITQKKLTVKQQLVFLFALFSSITAGHPQDFINSFLFLVIYTSLRIIFYPSWNKKEKISFTIKTIVPITAIPFLLASIQLLPTVELFRISARVPHDVGHILSTMLVQLWQLPMLIYQDFFGNPATKTYTTPDTYVGKTISIGVTGFSLAVWSLLNKQKNWHRTFFLITVAVMICISVASPLTQILYQFPIPILSTGTPTRNLFILLFALSVLAGFGLEAIYTKKYTAKKLIFASITLLILTWIAAIFLPHSFSFLLPGVLKKSAIIITALIGCSLCMFLASKYKTVFVYGFILLVFAELGYGFIKFNPFVPANFLYPENEAFTYLQKNSGVNRFWGYGTARFESNLNAQYHLFSTDGTDPLNIRWYNQFMQATKNGSLARVFNRSTRSDTGLAEGYGARDLPENTNRLRIMDLLGIQYVLDRPENPKDNVTFASSRFTPMTTLKNNYTIYKNKLAYPRAFLASQYQTYKTTDDFEKQFFAKEFDPRKTILLPEETPTLSLTQASYADATIVSYTPNEIIIETSSDATQLLFLSDTYAPGWVATIDDRDAEVLKADYAFRAVAVPEGRHAVRFIYAPVSVKFGFIGTCIGIISLGIYIGLGIGRKKRK
ncbi:MAG: YfhO family protein [Microgenomates group bacterium]